MRVILIFFIGNVATEDVAYMLKGLDIETNVSLDKLLEAAVHIDAVLGEWDVLTNIWQYYANNECTCIQMIGGRKSASKYTLAKLGQMKANESKMKASTSSNNISSSNLSNIAVNTTVKASNNTQ